MGTAADQNLVARFNLSALDISGGNSTVSALSVGMGEDACRPRPAAVEGVGVKATHDVKMRARCAAAKATAAGDGPIVRECANAKWRHVRMI